MGLTTGCHSVRSAERARLKQCAAYADTLVAQGQSYKAAAWYRDTAAAFERLLGPEHPDTLRARFHLATFLVDQYRCGEAEALYREGAAIAARVLEAKHRDTLAWRDGLAVALLRQYKYQAAADEFSAVLAIRQRVLGPEHPDTLRSCSYLADLIPTVRIPTDALTFMIEDPHPPRKPPPPGFRESHWWDLVRSSTKQLYILDANTRIEKEHRAILAIRQRVLGLGHPDTLASLNSLAKILQDQRKFTEAEPEWRTLLALAESRQGPDGPEAVSLRRKLAQALLNLGKNTEAETHYRNLVAHSPSDWDLRVEFFEIICKLCKNAEAEREARVLIEMGKPFPLGDGRYTGARCALAVCLDVQGKHVEAEKEHREVLAILERVLPPNHPGLAGQRAALAACLRAQGKKEDP